MVEKYDKHSVRKFGNVEGNSIMDEDVSNKDYMYDSKTFVKHFNEYVNRQVECDALKDELELAKSNAVHDPIAEERLRSVESAIRVAMLLNDKECQLQQLLSMAWTDTYSNIVRLTRSVRAGDALSYVIVCHTYVDKFSTDWRVTLNNLCDLLTATMSTVAQIAYSPAEDDE